jgi:hypothetical protein
MDVVDDLFIWTETWIQGVTASPPTFKEFATISPAVRKHLIKSLELRVNSLVQIVERHRNKFLRPRQAMISTLRSADGKLRKGSDIAVALHVTYEGRGPGELHKSGPRHDNDFVDIGEIRIVPTNSELLSKDEPFLPPNLYDAPHPLPCGSMERLLDIQFRLLREELT